MEFTANTEYWWTFRKDIMAYGGLSMPAKIILNTLLCFQKSGRIKLTIDTLSKWYSFSIDEMDQAFKELNRKGFFNDFEETIYTYTVILSKTSINKVFKYAVK